jgi:hypothetical protein
MGMFVVSVEVAPVDDWRERLLQVGIIDRSASNPRADFKRLKHGLQARHLIAQRDGLVWSVAGRSTLLRRCYATLHPSPVALLRKCYATLRCCRPARSLSKGSAPNPVTSSNRIRARIVRAITGPVVSLQARRSIILWGRQHLRRGIDLRPRHTSRRRGRTDR